MAADPIVYCLTHVTDYRRFESFCCDLMSKCGWVEIEPLGGSQDGGRDALHVGSKDGQAVVFAFSAREDWKEKLDEDLKRIKELKHQCTDVVFVTNRTVTATQRDDRIAYVLKTFGWRLDLYAVERIRVNLIDRARSLLAAHPSIFTPDFFPRSRDAEVQRPDSGGNTDLAAFELGFSSENLEYRVSLVAWMAGPQVNPDFQQPLEYLVPRLSASARVVLSASQSGRIEAALLSLRDKAFAASTSEQELLLAAHQAQAQLAATKNFMVHDRSRAAFNIGQLFGAWDRLATEERTATLEPLVPNLVALNLMRIAPKVDAMLVRFRERTSVADVHVPSELADLLRHELGLPKAVAAQSPNTATNVSTAQVPNATANWSEVEAWLRDPVKRFRRDGRSAWNALQAQGLPAPESVLQLAEDMILTAEDAEANATLDLLLREKGPTVVEIWRRMVGPLTRNELGKETRTGIAYQAVGDARAMESLLVALLQIDFADDLLSDLLSAVHRCVDVGGPVLRDNLDRIRLVCAKYEGHPSVARIRREL